MYGNTGLLGNESLFLSASVVIESILSQKERWVLRVKGVSLKVYYWVYIHCQWLFECAQGLRV
jgi:hypothetical protein